MPVRTTLSAARLVVCLTLTALAPSLTAVAQVTTSPTDVISSGTSYFVFTAPGQQTNRIIVFGAASPGIYEIGEGTTFSELVALVRANPETENSSKTTREVRIQLYREVAGQRSVVYEADYEEFLRLPGAHPTLQDGDVLIVEVTVREKTRLRDILQITSGLASLTLLVIRFAAFF